MSATIDVALLATFVAVADASSFSKAAAKLGATTATVSRAIAKLEAQVGSELIHRTTRRLSLSTTGAALYERTAPHVRALTLAANEVPERQEEPAGTLKITAPYDVGAILLGGLIARFVFRYPKIQIDANFTSRKVDIVGEGFDLAIRGATTKQPDSSLTVRRLSIPGFLGFYAAPTYVARRGTPRTLGASDHEWLVAAAMTGKGGVIELPRGLTPKIVANDFLFLREAARAGAGVALLPSFIAAPAVVTGQLVAVLAPQRIRTGGLVLLYPSSGQLARKVAAFRDFLIESVKKEGFE